MQGAWQVATYDRIELLNSKSVHVSSLPKTGMATCHSDLSRSSQENGRLAEKFSISIATDW
jgi:hypothetical protein